MIILILLVIIAFLAAAFFTNNTLLLRGIEKRGLGKNKKEYRFNMILSIVSSLILIASAVGLGIGISKPFVNSERVAYVYNELRDEFDTALHYDSENDEYFIAEDSWYNVFEPVYRIAVDGEDAKEYVDAYNALTQIEVERKS